MTGGRAGTDANRRLSWGFPAVALALVAVIAAAFGISHACGLRDGVSQLFTASFAGTSGQVAWAIIYVSLYLCIILLAPVLTIAAGLFLLFQLIVRRGASGRRGDRYRVSCS